MNEFDLIRRYFDRPAADPAVRLAVGDDAAILAPTPGHELLVSTDMLVCGRHFFADVDPRALGHKALAVNLSDIAAMGGAARWATLAAAWPELDADWLAAFAEGWFALADAHEVALIGGDTTRGPLTLSVSIFGEAPAGRALRRDGGRAGDDVWVSGELGMAAAAVRARLGQLTLPEAERALAQQRLDWPQPRLALGQALRGLASAALDVSDGLLADLGHLAARSGVAAWVRADWLPMPACLREQGAAGLACAAAGGDDYELCFAAPPSARAALADLGRALAVPLTRIGALTEGVGCRLLNPDGSDILLEQHGYDHFA